MIRWPINVLLAAVMLVGATAAGAADALWSVERLNAAQTDWAQLVGTPMRVEGRVSSQIKGQIRFQKCDLTFRLANDQERKLTNVKFLEVSGRLQRDGNKFIFDVSDLKPLPSDREQFQSREAALRNPQPKDLYELGEWATSRGVFYDDKELVDLGKNVQTRALNLEWHDLPKDAVEERFQLAEKAVSLQLAKPFIEELRHEACRSWLTRCLKQSPPDEKDLAALEAKVRTLFPDAFLPLKAWPTDLTRSYSLDPVETYRTADANQRPVLHRLLGADVQWPKVIRDAAADGSNGDAIADRIDQYIPERHAIAEQYRERELQYRLKNIGLAPRSAALELSAAFRGRKQPDLAVDTLRKWLAAKERKQPPEEAPQFIELADDYLSLLQDEPRAVALLSEAHRREPKSADVQQRFDQLGYKYDGIRWKKPTTTTASPADPASVTSDLPTQLVVGMTAAQLDQLLGKPTATTVMRSATSIDEVRIFGRIGEGSRIVVQLRRGPGDPQPVVTRFDSR